MYSDISSYLFFSYSEEINIYLYNKCTHYIAVFYVAAKNGCFEI